MLDSFLELGCSAFDTAALYQAGGTERVLGEWLTLRKNRDRLFLITKGAHPSIPFGASRFSRKALRVDLESSLRRLRTDHVDLYLLHRDDPSRPFDELIDFLMQAQREGKIGAYGVSNWWTDRIEAAMKLAQSRGGPTLAASSPHYSLADWVRVPWAGCVSLAGAQAQAARDFHRRTQLPVIAWSALGHGFFGDRITEQFHPGFTNFAARSCLNTYGSPNNFARKRRAEELAKTHGVATAQIALAYLFHQPFPVFTVVASTSAERMKSNIAAADLSLSPQEVRYLEGGA